MKIFGIETSKGEIASVKVEQSCSDTYSIKLCCLFLQALVWLAVDMSEKITALTKLLDQVNSRCIMESPSTVGGAA